MANCGERSAPPASSPAAAGVASVPAGPGGRRTKRAAGISSPQASTPIAAIAVRQSYEEISHPANGVIVIGATPMPAETRLTASARPVSNHPVTAAIIGAKKAPAETPTRRPKPSWKVSGLVARLATTRPSPSSTAPIITTGRGPIRSLTVPQKNPASPMTRKSIVIAVEIIARLQPVSADIGSRNTASENIAPIATQPMRPPRKTITQRYDEAIGGAPLCRTTCNIPTGWYVGNTLLSRRPLAGDDVASP